MLNCGVEDELWHLDFRLVSSLVSGRCDKTGGPSLPSAPNAQRPEWHSDFRKAPQNSRLRQVSMNSYGFLLTRRTFSVPRSTECLKTRNDESIWAFTIHQT